MNHALPVSAAPPYDERESLQSCWGIVFALGLVSVIVGLIAIGSPHIATSKSVMIFGIVLLVAGGTELIHAIMVRNGKGVALHLVSAALYLIVGLFMIEDPVRVAVVLTLLLAASFLVGGLLRIFASALLHFPAWPWVMLNGVIDLFLGIFILSEWPESSLWVIGLFVGIDLLFHGWSWIVLALSVRNYRAAAQTA
jgi:uncharacterized membrane protein HdeD (DUF308 family)